MAAILAAAPLMGCAVDGCASAPKTSTCIELPPDFNGVVTTVGGTPAHPWRAIPLQPQEKSK